MSEQTQKIKSLASRYGILRPRDVEAHGIPRVYLHRMVQAKQLLRVSRGLYTLPGRKSDGSSGLGEVAKRAPKAVVCLLSALQYHSITTQLPREIWIAIQGTGRKPEIGYPPVKVVRFSGKAFEYGVQEKKIGGVPVKIYSPAKTVADCFKYRHKIGLDVALEALKEVRRSRKASIEELRLAAQACRASKVMRSYLEALA